ncbi:bifunctional DNA primase/polymerase [Pseudonocardia abyssalis]|uniref:Bifunctional DNA primase/polymerase n=1 Tax=Pseudonocardia abyssalis TaxID=2792008 RepID=A0ABS6UX70_9PSEU|nr:bifunctional DNA primase/polymerase [Pseudonocardia abyssalis]MBW0115406.1 bifunctional DNA primase/polymerase [Pseudonocardia abyssalis]MBW0136846.1 bifunctional DNA primase/polymerase [Pseudonocardia abyssalis]
MDKSMVSDNELRIPLVTPETPMLDAALAYAEAGWFIIPVKQSTKHPGSVLGGGWETKSSRDPAVIADWFHYFNGPRGIALHCGRSGAVVIDVDHPDKVTEDHPLYGPLFVTTPPWQSSRTNIPRKGHYIFTQPAGRNIGNSLGMLAGGWGDVRGENGVIIVSPTKHEDSWDNGLYRWESTGAVPVLPASIADLLPDASDKSPYSYGGAELREFIETFEGGTHPHLFNVVLDQVEVLQAAGEARHDIHLKALCWAYRDVMAGCYSAEMATESLRAWFDAATGGGRESEAERNELWALNAALDYDPSEHVVHAPKRLPSLGDHRV